MPGQSADQRRLEAFKRAEQGEQAPGDLSREFEQTAKDKKRGKTGSDGEGSPSGKTLHLPVRTGGRATLVERENPEELLEFHWDPTSYNIGKEANWDFKAPTAGTAIAEYTGCGPTIVSFDMFLNDIGQPHKTQRSVEDSIEWLWNRLRPRSEEAVKRRGFDRTRNRRWISQHDPTAPKRPPILVLFGLRDGFECVMTSCRLRTIFQAPPLGGEFGLVFGNATNQTGVNRELGFNLGIRGDGGGAFPDRASAAEHARSVGGKAITRATIAITLKEFVNAPAVG